MSKPPSQGKLLYHITHIDNIPSILKYGLLSREELKNLNNIAFKDIADQDIIEKRKGHALENYVLFHFFSKNPFDGIVCQKYGSKKMAIIAIYRPKSENNFFIIPTHPLDAEEPDIYPYDEGFQLVKWDILDDFQNRDYHNSMIKKACMAECLSSERIDPDEIAYIYVYNDEIRRKLVNKIPSKYIDKISVNKNMFP